MFRISNFLLLLFLIFSISCELGTNKKDQNERNKAASVRDLNSILKDGKLKVLTVYSGTSYFLYRGKPMGFEYELLQRFAEQLGVELDLYISNDIDSLFFELEEGNYDLVAYGLTITGERQKFVDFTDYLFLTNQVLVQKKPDDWRTLHWSKLESALIHDAIELIGDTVSVRHNTSYYHRLKNLAEEIGGEIFIDTLGGNLSTDRILKMVVDGEIKHTIADNNLAGIYASYYPILDVTVPVSFSQRIGWAVRKDAVGLKDTLDSWLDEMKKHADYYVIYKKYFENERSFRKRIQSDFLSLNENKISPYDEMIKQHADKLGWDWRLLASLVYQESRFNPKARSWAGARGLMQLMPATAKGLGVKNREDPADNLKGGSTYLKKIGQRFEDIPDSIQRIKFIMASYNCGYNHVEDGQRIALKNGFDKFSWDGHVAEMVLELSYPEAYNDDTVRFGYVKGIEPYTYVDQIFKRYEHYKKFIKQ